MEAHIEFKQDISISAFDTIIEEMKTLIHTDYNINHVTFNGNTIRMILKDMIVQDIDSVTHIQKNKIIW
jgi:cobalt-zinc-cadmium efflux system protein